HQSVVKGDVEPGERYDVICRVRVQVGYAEVPQVLLLLHVDCKPHDSADHDASETEGTVGTEDSCGSDRHDQEEDQDHAGGNDETSPADGFSHRGDRSVAAVWAQVHEPEGRSPVPTGRRDVRICGCRHGGFLTVGASPLTVRAVLSAAREPDLEKGWSNP